MKLYLKYDSNITFKSILKEQLDKLNVNYKINGLGEVEFLESLEVQTLQELTMLLSIYGISIIDDHKTQLVQKIKDLIAEMISLDEKITVNTSTYLSDKLGYSYAYLSNLFSEITYTSIENFIIITKIDKAKELIISQNLSLTEVSHKLGYSSVAHLSGQFKKLTGITPSQFQRIISQRKLQDN